MATVALVIHHERPEASALTSDAVASLAARGHDVRLPTEDARAVGLPERAWGEANLAEGAELVISLGGDGTVLRAVELACPWKVPVLGVNLGRLGYLTEVEPSGLRAAMDRFWAGEYQVEERMTLSVSVRGGAGPAEGGPAGAGLPMVALNEAVVEKSESGHTVNLAVTISGRPFLNYAADGLIVATPTGSTAYNLSARGPIVSPRLKALVVTPVSPHMLFDRPLILEPTESIRLQVIDGRPAELVVDGRRHVSLGPGDVVECRAGANDARLVSFGARDFHHILKAKFGLVDR